MKEHIKLWEELYTRVIEKVGLRKIVLNPFKLDPKRHLYQFALTKNEWAAFRYLRDVKAFKSAINTGWGPEAIVCFPSDSGVRDLRTAFPSGNEPNRYYPSLRIDLAQLPGDVRDYLIKYCKYERKLMDQEEAVADRLWRVRDLCNTWGQVMRMWPDLAAQFPAEMKQKYWKRKAKSSMPHKYYKWDTSKLGECVRVGIDDYYAPEVFEEATMVILEAFMLPEPEDQQRVTIRWR